MSAFSVQSEQGPPKQSTFGTKDPVLAATLGNFGFQAKNALPVLLVVSSSAVVDLVDKKTGRVEDCAHLEFRFEAEILHDVFGKLSAYDISKAHEIARLAQKEQTKDITGAEALLLKSLRERWHQKKIGPDGVNHAGTLLWAVQLSYDEVTNFLIICTVAKELARNPLISYARQVHRGVAYAVEPAQSEPLIQRRSEKLFKGTKN